MAKDYAVDSDVIEIADPLFYPGDKVQYMTRELTVRDAAYHTLHHIWTYCLVCLGSELVAVENAGEYELSLMSRPLKAKSKGRKVKFAK